MKGQPGSFEWKSSGFGFSRLSNRDRCLPTRLGGILQWSVHRGSMVSRGISFHINCLELLAGAFAVKIFVKGKVRLLMENLTAAHFINKMGAQNPLFWHAWH